MTEPLISKCLLVQPKRPAVYVHTREQDPLLKFHTLCGERKIDVRKITRAPYVPAHHVGERDFLLGCLSLACVDKQGKQIVVEVGTATGGSALAINQWLTWLKVDYQLICIDPFTDGGDTHHRDWIRNNKEFVKKGTCQLIEKKSDDVVPPDAINFFFVDANHTVPLVTFHGTEYGKHVVESGIMLFHDTAGKVVQTALTDLRLETHGWRLVGKIVRPGATQEGMEAYVRTC